LVCVVDSVFWRSGAIFGRAGPTFGVKVECPEAEPRTYDLDGGRRSPADAVIAGTVWGMWMHVPQVQSSGRAVRLRSSLRLGPPAVGGRGHGAFHVRSGGVNQTRVPPPAPVGNLTCGDLAPVHGRNVSCRTRDWGGGMVQGSDVAVAHAVEDQSGQFAGGGGLGDVAGFGAAADQDAVLDRADR
jgi:hypothetical protein